MNLNDYDIAARTVYGEARGEDMVGKLAVAYVIRNRWQDPSRWPRTPEAVCKQPWQFSCWNDGDPNRAAMLEVNYHDPALRECLAAVALAFAETDTIEDPAEDPTGGANHYHHVDLSPDWADKNRRTMQIGDHQFYRL